MSHNPHFVVDSKVLFVPFDKAGNPTLVTSIVATLLSNKPLKKEEILGKISEKHLNKTRGYLSNHFSELSKSGILKFSKLGCTWRQGENYQEYMGFIFMKLLDNDAKAVNSLQYKLMPTRDAQSVDFILSPEDNLFDQPNPYLDEED